MHVTFLLTNPFSFIYDLVNFYKVGEMVKKSYVSFDNYFVYYFLVLSLSADLINHVNKGIIRPWKEKFPRPFLFFNL